VLAGVGAVEEDGAVEPEGGAALDSAGAVCAGGCDACSGVEELLLHPALQSSAAGSRREAASVNLLDIEHPPNTTNVMTIVSREELECLTTRP
jgi:hypothetical protein